MRKRLVRAFGIIGFAVLLMLSAWSIHQSNDKIVYIYMTRHGQTVGNTKELMIGRYGDSELTDVGVLQAEKTGEALKGVPFQKAYSSTIERAIDTEKIILAKSGNSSVEREELPDLDDISWGDVEGMTQQQYLEKHNLSEFPEPFGDVNDERFVSPVGAESKYQFYNRFDRAMEQIVRESDDGAKVLVVAHSSMTFWLSKKFEDATIDHIENASITVLKYDHGQWSIEKLNDITHLR